MANLEENLTKEFADALRGAKPDAKVDDLGYAGFADSLLEGLEPAAVRAVFETADSRGPGTREPRVYSARSDLMLLVNVLAPWLQDLAALRLAGLSGFRELRFDVRLPAVGGEGAGWLPALLVSPGGLVGVESDCAGYLAGHRVGFSEAQEHFWEGREENGWRREMLAMQSGERGYARLDAARLIKQYMGLRLLLEAAAGEGGRLPPATMLFLFWEPLNSARFSECDELHREIGTFSEAVAGSEIGFAAMSYFDLWADWARGEAPGWLPLHITRLHQRYSFRI